MDEEEVTRLRRAVGRLTRALNAAATSEGLTPTQASVLALVASRGPLALGTLIELEQLNPTMLSRVIGKLDTAGLITRATDATDQRSVRVEITTAGWDTSRRVTNRRSALVSECVDHLPPDQAAALRRGVPALEALADQLPIHHRNPAGSA
jgi:DNA-binding MarR family transcriptional regulator